MSSLFVPDGYVPLALDYGDGNSDFQQGGRYHPPPWVFWNTLGERAFTNTNAEYSWAIRDPKVSNNSYWIYESCTYNGWSRVAACALIGVLYGMTALEPAWGYRYREDDPQDRYGLAWWSGTEITQYNITRNGWKQLDVLIFQASNFWHSQGDHTKTFQAWCTTPNPAIGNDASVIAELQSDFFNQYGTLHILADRYYEQVLSIYSLNYGVRCYQAPQTMKIYNRLTPPWLYFEMSKRKKGGGKLYL